MLDVAGDIQGYSLSALQELGVVNPVLGSALWKLLQTSLDALTKSIWEDEHGAMQGPQSTCPADISPVRHLVPWAAPGKQLLALPEPCSREGITLLAVPESGDVGSELSFLSSSSCWDEMWKDAG